MTEIALEPGTHDRFAVADPATLPVKASRFIPNADDTVYRLWSISPMDARAQLFVVMPRGVRTSGSGPHRGWTYLEAGSDGFAELVKFTGRHPSPHDTSRSGYGSGMAYAEDFESTEPRCPDCGVIMRTEEGGWSCPSCQRFEPFEQGTLPPPFDGPALHGN